MEDNNIFKLPSLSEDMAEAVLVAWMKESGEVFKEGDLLYEVEADKVVHQVEATEAGTLIEQLVEEGDHVQVGQALARWSK